MRLLGYTLGALAGLALLWAGPLSAQVCAGFAALDGTRFRVAVSAASYTYADAVGASLTTGRELFVTLGTARLYDEELDDTAYDIGLEVGVDVSDARRRGFLCPVAALSVSIQPRDNVLFAGSGFRRISGALGVGLAGVVLRSRGVAIHPAASVRAIHLRARESYPGGHRDDSDTYFVLSGGVGLVILDVLTIRPGVSIPYDLQPGTGASYAWPFGREEQELSFDISIGFNFGRRAPRSAR